MAGSGGSWKVAYADFATAMMALFLVLWLTSQDQKIKQAIARSFRHPYHSFKNRSAGLLPNKKFEKTKAGKGSFDSASAVELIMLRRINQDLLKSLKDDPIIKENDTTFDLKVTPEGVRITLFDKADRPIFLEGSSGFTEYGDWVVQNLGWVIERFKSFGVELEGHASSSPNLSQNEYNPWELSMKRAMATRKKLVNVLLPNQILKVSGLGDSRPLTGKSPDDPANNRISVLLKVRDTATQFVGKSDPNLIESDSDKKPNRPKL